MAEKISRLSLSTIDLTNQFFEDTQLLGIMSSVKDYQLCWQLNNKLGMGFRLNNDLEIQLSRKQRNYFFSVYEYAEPMTFLTHYVYNNLFDGEYLLPEFKHLDYLWLMKGDHVSPEALQQTITALRSVSNIQLVVELLQEKIKNKEHLIF